ncbi:hypothetical protein ACFYMD_32945 [Streptomyces griseus]|uniref:hypothetical protein n=1 Tax=Streptomyces griseus TaxID=1911 RepID=UPI00369A5F17
MDCYEIDDYRAADITRAGIARHVTTADFLTVEPQPTYDVVAMYPPHRRDLAAKHILHAHRFLRPGGVLGALVSLGIQNTAGAAGPKLLQLLDHTHVLDDIDLQDGYLLSPTGLRRGPHVMTNTADPTPPWAPRAGGGPPRAGPRPPTARPRPPARPATRPPPGGRAGGPPRIHPREPPPRPVPHHHPRVRGAASLPGPSGRALPA